MDHYHQMSNMPSHGNASHAKVGNGMMPGYKEGMAYPSYKEGMHGYKEGYCTSCGCGHHDSGKAGGMLHGSCAFAMPPPKRCYCHPAAFTSLNGQSKHRILDAYGNSRPCGNNY